MSKGPQELEYSPKEWAEIRRQQKLTAKNSDNAAARLRKPFNPKGLTAPLQKVGNALLNRPNKYPGFTGSELRADAKFYAQELRKEEAKKKWKEKYLSSGFSGPEKPINLTPLRNKVKDTNAELERWEETLPTRVAKKRTP
jgi:hypothetical protein